MIEKLEQRPFVELTMLDECAFNPSNAAEEVKFSEILQTTSRKQGSNE
jgi:hypothetical protein